MLILSAVKQYTVTFTAPAAGFLSLHAAMLASLPRLRWADHRPARRQE